jgi:hypothetical protein
MARLIQGGTKASFLIQNMRNVRRGNGIKFLDEQFETAAFKTLLGLYSHLVTIENPDDLDNVLFVFQTYVYNEYQRLYSFLKKIGSHYETCDCMQERLKLLGTSIDQKLFIAPSEILRDLYKIKNFKSLIHVQEVSVSCCLKLK